jgi:hypothetical protein
MYFWKPDFGVLDWVCDSSLIFFLEFNFNLGSGFGASFKLAVLVFEKSGCLADEIVGVSRCM